MDKWEAHVSSFPTDASVVNISKTVELAKELLKEDLVLYEIDWLLTTLFSAPIQLLDRLQAHCQDELWTKVIGDAFEVVSSLIESYKENAERYDEKIIETCLFPYPAHTRRRAMQCLCRASTMQSGELLNPILDTANALVNSEAGAIVTASRAMLIGSICENHPELLTSNRVTEIWRSFLCLLEGSKTSDSISNATLQGILSLFKYFGEDLPTLELNEFFDKISATYIRVRSCKEVSLQIISQHGKLFPEKLRSDKNVTDYLWTMEFGYKSVDILKSVYKVMVNQENVTRIITDDIMQKLNSDFLYTRIAAICIFHDVLSNFENIKCSIDAVNCYNEKVTSICTKLKCNLELKLSTFNDETWSYDQDVVNMVEEASMYIKSKIGDENMLKLIVMLRKAIPSNRRKKLIVHSLLLAEDSVRTATITFLINDSLTNNPNSKYWFDIFDSAKSTDQIVSENCRAVFDDILTYVVIVGRGCLDLDQVENSTLKVSKLFEFASKIVRIENPRDFMLEYANDMIELCFECNKVFGPVLGILLFMKELLQLLDENDMIDSYIQSHTQNSEMSLRGFYDSLKIRACTDDATLIATCMCLLEFPKEFLIDSEQINKTVSVILSSPDIEPKSLSRVLKKIDFLIQQDVELDQLMITNKINNLIKKLNSKTKEERMLKRDFNLFIGKYSIHENLVQEHNFVDLKESLSLNLLNLKDGNNLKINLANILNDAILYGDPKIMFSLLEVLTAKYLTNNDPVLQEMILTLVVNMSSFDNTESLVPVVSLFDKQYVVLKFVDVIKKEILPSRRSSLADMIQVLISMEPTSKTTESTLVKFLDKLVDIMQGDCESQINELLKTATQGMSLNNDVTMSHLPKVLLNYLKCDSQDTIILNEYFAEKIILFDKKILEDLLSEIISIIKEYNDKIAICMPSIKSISSVLGFDCFQSIRHVEGVDRIKCLIEVRKHIDLDVHICRELISYNNFECMKFLDENWFEYLVFEFCTVYADVLMEFKYQETLQRIANSISNITIENLVQHGDSYKNCMKTFKRICKKTPNLFTDNLEIFVKKIDFDKVKDGIWQNCLDEYCTNVLLCMKVLLNCFEVKHFHTYKSVISEWCYLIDLNTIYKKTHELIIQVSIQFLDETKIKDICIGDFLRYSYTFAELLCNKQIFMQLHTNVCMNLLNGIAKCYSKRNCSEHDCVVLKNCVEQAWPVIQNEEFIQLHTILYEFLKIDSFNLDLNGPTGSWCMNLIKTSEDKDVKVKLMYLFGIFIKNEIADECMKDFEKTLTSLSAILPTSVTSQSDYDVTAAVLNVISHSRNKYLMPLLLAMLSYATLPRWLVTGVQQCVSVTGYNINIDFLLHTYNKCKDFELSIHLYERVLVPLIRASPVSICVEFFIMITQDILNSLNRKVRYTNNVIYSVYMVETARAFNLAQVLYEKLPQQELDQNSTLHKSLILKYSKNLTGELCKLCGTLRSIEIKADDSLIAKEAYRYFQMSNYNCLATVLLKTKADLKYFNFLNANNVWDLIIDSDKRFVVYIEPFKKIKQQRHLQEDFGASSQLSTTLTDRRSVFFSRTLSDNPFQYDFHKEISYEESQSQSVILSDNELNTHSCAATVTEVFQYLIDKNIFRIDCLIETLTVSCSNVKMFVSQIIINCADIFVEYASQLTPVLLSMVKDTAYEVDGKKYLNGLHVNVLNTLSKWLPSINQSYNPNVSIIQSIIEYNINTCMKHKRKSVYKVGLKCLDEFTKSFNCMKVYEWSLDIESLTDPIDLEILSILTKNGIVVPELSKMLIQLLSRSDKLPAIARLLGHSISSQNGGHKMASLSKWRSHLERLRVANCQDYVRVLFYAQIGCQECCDDVNFRHITELTPKMQKEQQSKCIAILSNYAKTHPTNESLRDLFDKIDLFEILIDNKDVLKLYACGFNMMSMVEKRRVVFACQDICASSVERYKVLGYELVCVSCEDFFKNKENSPKRIKLEYSSNILQLLNEKDLYPKTILSLLAKGVKDVYVEKIVKEKLVCIMSSDVYVRFCECILLLIWLPISMNEDFSAQNSMDAILELFFDLFIQQDGFDKLVLSECDLPICNLPSNVSVTTSSSRINSNVRIQINNDSNQDCVGTNLNVKKPLMEVLKSLSDFCQKTTNPPSHIIKEIIKSIHNDNIKAQNGLARMFFEILSMKKDSDMTVHVLEWCRCIVDECCQINGFIQLIENILYESKGSKNYGVTMLLYTDLLLRRNDLEYFELGKKIYMLPIKNNFTSSEDFSVDDLSQVFGTLSNWDNLTIQERVSINNQEYPMFWTSHSLFEDEIKKYQGSIKWLSIMKSALNKSENNCEYLWLNHLNEWPKRCFDMSAISESISWLHSSCENIPINPVKIRKTDCIAQWAVRLMMRSQHRRLHSDDANLKKEMRAQELVWCERAINVIPDFVLQCVKRNFIDLHESETLQWLHQQALALRQIGLRNNNMDMLKKALKKIESFANDYVDASTHDVVSAVVLLRAQLMQDLNALSTQDIDEILIQMKKSKHSTYWSDKATKNSLQIYEMIMCHYADKFENSDESMDQNYILERMTSTLKNIKNLNTKDLDLYVGVLLNKLNHYNGLLPKELGRKIFDVIQSTNPNRSVNIQLSKLNHLFPEQFKRDKQTNICTERLKRQLQLITDPYYSLNQFCEQLNGSLKKNDAESWNDIFNNIKLLYENEYSGPAYKLMQPLLNNLFQIQIYEPTQEFASKAECCLRDIHGRTDRCIKVISLSDLCPTLLVCDGPSLGSLLGVPNIECVKFCKEITIFTNSIRRPCVLTVILSSGKKLRLMIKRGEPLEIDAAITDAVKVFNNKSEYQAKRYNVIPLGPDSALIEYLDNYVTIKEMISKQFNINEISNTIRRPADPDLILKSNTEIENFKNICKKIPSYILRSSIERNCLTTEEFLMKLNTFQDSLAAMTVYHSILGLGDRHLENLLYSTKTGEVCAVDYATALQYGVSGSVPEMASARLTRQLMAVCEPRVLESRIQKVFTDLRKFQGILVPSIELCLGCIPENENNLGRKITYIKKLLKGELLSHQVLRDSLEKSQIKNQEYYTALLDEIFDDVPLVGSYDIACQVTCLLRLCTDMRILNVSRRGWEPWL